MTTDNCTAKKSGLARLKQVLLRNSTHEWITTHKNLKGMATRQICRCGLNRYVIETPHESYEHEKSFTFWWHYSDDRPDEKDERIFKHTCELTPPNRVINNSVDSNPPFAEAKK